MQNKELDQPNSNGGEMTSCCNHQRIYGQVGIRMDSYRMGRLLVDSKVPSQMEEETGQRDVGGPLGV